MRQIQKMYTMKYFTLGMDGYVLVLRFLVTKAKKKT